MRSIKKLKNLAGKKVLVRVDFNVPIGKGKVLDDSRLYASLPTIQYLLKRKAKVILVSHLGRPEGIDSSLSLVPVTKRLGELMKKNIKILDIKILKKYFKNIDGYFEYARNEIKKMKNGQILMLENIRFFAGERNNDGVFSKQLSELCDVFVLDGFAVAHRASPSVTGVTKYASSYAGLLLEQEIDGLNKVVKNPKKPFVVVLGGAKTGTKIPVMKNLLPKCNFLIIGGGIVNTYLKALGYEIGSSLVDNGLEKEILKYCKSKKVIKPVDVVVGTMDGARYRVVELQKKPQQICQKGEAILDCGPQTIRLYATYIKKAQTLVWNGAMGLFEQKPYDVGTFSIARLVASRSKGKAYGVIGGGETLQSMDLVGMKDCVDLVSTGGGAMLEFLSGKKLPGVMVVSN